MDECLPLESVSAPTRRTLLTQERARRADLEQEVVHLRAALARQNEVIIGLQRRDAQRERELQALRTQVAALTEQNALLRQQVAALRQENARLRGEGLGTPPAPEPTIKPATSPREPKVRRKRAPEHNHGRQKLERANRWEDHAAERCPGCGEDLHDGWIHRRIQVIDLPPVAPLEITEHRIIRRQCPRCGMRVLPDPVGTEAGRIGRRRFGPRLMAAMTIMATVERLPGRMIQERLWREYGLRLSHGAIIGLLKRMAQAGQPAYDQLQREARASPVIHADETGWRENGQHTTVWIVTTPQLLLVHHGRRTNQEIDGILGADFAGTIVADCYAAYDHFDGPKQRCWAHLVRDLEALLAAHGDDVEVVAWVEGILDVYEQARQPRPAQEEGTTPEASRAREQRARRYELLIMLLCPRQPDPSLPYATLAKRLRTHLGELFTFVRDPRVPATNNLAERGLRPLVISRKVSGGTRSSAGSETRMTLYSLCATARLQGKNPTTVCEQLLLAPPDAPSPLALPPPTA